MAEKAEEKVIKFLLSHPTGEFYEKEIAQKSGVSKSAVNYILPQLVKRGILKRKERGRLNFYEVDLTESLVQQMKRTLTIEELQPLVEKLKKISKKIVLFGSAAEGTDAERSDIDLLVITSRPTEVRRIARESNLRKRLSLIVHDFLEWVKIEKKDKTFASEVKRGVVLWEEYGQKDV